MVVFENGKHIYLFCKLLQYWAFIQALSSTEPGLADELSGTDDSLVEKVDFAPLRNHLQYNKKKNHIYDS